MGAADDLPVGPGSLDPGSLDRRVVEVRAADTHDLRRRVLRVGTPTTEVRFAEDELEGTFHLAVVVGGPDGAEESERTEGSCGAKVSEGAEESERTDRPGRITVAISTWVPRRHPDHPALEGFQLRGMATDPSVRGTGCGALVLHAGLDQARQRGAELVWARARDTALEFYLAHGFVTFGPGYTDLATALPHHDVIHHLAAG